MELQLQDELAAHSQILLSRQAFGLFDASYASADFRRKNGLWRDGRVVVPERSYFVETQRDTIARLQSRGILAP